MPVRVIRLFLTFAIMFGVLADQGAGQSKSADTVVICPQGMRQAMSKWVTHRQLQGHRIHWMSNSGTAPEITERLRRRFRMSPFKAILVIGDAKSSTQPSDLQTPTHLVDAKVNVKFGSEPQIASDSPYADMNGDTLPDVAIGRLPADNAVELEALAVRIVDYETNTDFGPWRSKLNFVAGVGGFGAIADMALEMTTKTFLTEGVPPSYLTSMTYGSWRSAYCPDPRDFHKTTLSRLNEGCLFWIYIGHGQKTYLDYVRVPGRAYGILANGDAPKLAAQKQPPIAIFLSCYAGAFDYRQDCLSEVMLKQPGGPIAVYSGSRVTMPYAMAVMSHSLLRLHFVEQHATLGELLRRCKRELVLTPEDGPNVDRHRMMLDKLAAAISPAPKLLAEERAEHILLFNLIGDPLLRMPCPSPVNVVAPDEAKAGETIEVALEGGRGKAMIELVCRRDLTRRPAPFRSQFDSAPAALRAYNQTYQMANDPVWVRQSTQLRGATTLQLTIPAEARGPCFVRVHVAGDAGFAIGSAAVYVRPADRKPDNK